MLLYLFGFGIFIIPLYLFKNKLIYNFLLYYDLFLNYTCKNISYTGINNKHIINTNNIKDIKNYDIILVNFNVNNKIKRTFYKNNIDFTLNNIPNYNSQIILATIDLYNNNKIVLKDIDITHELNQFMLYNSSISLTNSKLDKLLWISLINNKFNYDYSKDLTINYKLMKDDITIVNGNNINILVKDGELNYL